MVMVALEELEIGIPLWVADLASFRRWTEMDDFPEEGRIDFFDDTVWLDMSKEQVYSHAKVKTTYGRVLDGLADSARLGDYFVDGPYVTNETARFSVRPDGVFVSTISFERGRVQLVEGSKGGYVELIGIPDMMLEIVSDSSVAKDTKRLREQYEKAGISEYWIVDCRADQMNFEILRLTRGKYRAVKAIDGWLKSPVFGKSFRIRRTRSVSGVPTIALEVK